MPLQKRPPEPPAQGAPGTPTAQLPAGLLAAGLAEEVLQFNLGQPAGPIHLKGGFIAPLPQSTGREGGQPQAGRTTQPPVGDEHSTPLQHFPSPLAAAGGWGNAALIAGGEKPQSHRIHGHPCQLAQRRRIKAEAEQRGNRRHNRVSHGAGNTVATGVAAGRQHQPIRHHNPAIAQTKPKNAILDLGRLQGLG